MDLLKLLGKLIGMVGEEPVPLKPQRPSAPRKPASRRRNGNTGSRRRNGSSSRTSTVYGAEPIVRTGSQMLQQVPLRIRQMRTLSSSNPFERQSMEATFYRQGKYMEQFTDDYYESVPCTRRVPMYYNLRDAELRTYFTWRSRYRQGALPETDTPYLLLYAFELINLIGVQTPAEGYALLKQLFSDYSGTNPELKQHLPRWVRDYAVYYGMEYSADSMDQKEAALDAVLRQSEQSAEQMTEALDILSKYHILRSKLYDSHPEETSAVVQSTYRSLLQYYAETKGVSFASLLFGGRVRERYLMFENAVFYEQKPAADRSVRLSPRCLYECRGGVWAVEQSFGKPDSERIGEYLRTIDSLLRNRLQMKGKLKAGSIPEEDSAVIQQVIEAYFAEQARKNAPVITLDAAELAEIRAAAEHTADMLTLPEASEPQP